MFGIGETEFAIIVLFGFLLFGPDKLPGAGRTIGRAIRQFREAEEGFTKVVQTEIVDPIQSAVQAPAETAAKKANDVASDDDLPEDSSAAPAAPSESFAERKARMEAERKGKEASSTDSASAGAGPASDDDLPEEAVDEDAKEETTPARRSAASLYGLDSSADPTDASSDREFRSEQSERGLSEQTDEASVGQAEAGEQSERESHDEASEQSERGLSEQTDEASVGQAESGEQSERESYDEASEQSEEVDGQD